MNIKLLELVSRSGFKKYYFIVDAKEFEKGTVIEREVTRGGKHKATLEFYFNQTEMNSMGWRYYDIGKCMNLVSPTAEIVAKYIEQSKMFEFDYLDIDYASRTAYIYLRRV